MVSRTLSGWLLGLATLALSAIGFSAEAPKMAAIDEVGPRVGPMNVKEYARIIYVSNAKADGNARGTHDHPFNSPEAALASITDASADNRYAICVAEGWYTSAMLHAKPFVDLYGSFSAADWTERDLREHATILDADSAGPVIIAADRSRIDGFTITGGKNDASGGAIVCAGVSPVISNNIITGNRTIHSPVVKPESLHFVGHEGGAIAALDGASPQITGNLVYNNSTDVGDGGAIVVRGGSNPSITNNAIVGNRSGLMDITMYDGKVGSRSSNGAGISVSDTCAPQITRNVIARNQAFNTSDGGGIYVEFEAMPHIQGNWLVGNVSSDDGGSIYVRGLSDNTPAKGKGPLIEGNVFAGSRVFHVMRQLDRFDEAIFLSKSGRATIRGNLFTGGGSAVGVANSSMTFEDNIVVNNVGDGVYVDLRQAGVPLSVVTGNIFWGNGQAQYTTVRTLSAVPTVSNNIIQGGYAGEGNRDENPGFSDDGLIQTAVKKAYDPSRCITTITLRESPPAVSLAGRLIRVGKQWSVINSSTGHELNVWGEIDDLHSDLLIPSTFRRQ